MLTVYGIKTCDTVRKALKWLDIQGLAYTYHDLRKDGLDDCSCRRWVMALGWESVLNRRSTTWKKLTQNERNIENADQAVNLLLTHPTLVKRPVFEGEGFMLLGFNTDVQMLLSGQGQPSDSS